MRQLGFIKRIYMSFLGNDYPDILNENKISYHITISQKIRAILYNNSAG